MEEHNQEPIFFNNIQSAPQYQNQPIPPKNRQGMIIAVTVILSTVMIIAGCIGALALRSVITKKTTQSEPQESAQTEPYVLPLPQPDEHSGESVEGDDLEEWEKQLTYYSEKDNPFLDSDYKSHMGTDHKNHSRDEFKDKYYVAVCDCISKDVPYTIKRDYYTYASEESNTQIHVSCVSLDGNLNNLDALNKAIYDKTMFLAKVYLENYQTYSSTRGINIMVDSYVTYNDESKLSIVLDEYYIVEKEVNIDLYCINVELDSGMILNNAKILNYTESFAEEFREKSARQNGRDTALDGMDTYDILALLKDEYNNIIFYTPLGMELGINYVLNGTSGWITVTYPDYQNYTNSL